jgi:hypothetical protein
VCCCFVPYCNCGFILYELEVIQTDTSVLVNDIIGHRDVVNGLLGGCMKDLGACECKGAENTWIMMLSVLCIVSTCPVPSVVPG